MLNWLRNLELYRSEEKGLFTKKTTVWRPFHKETDTSLTVLGKMIVEGLVLVTRCVAHAACKALHPGQQPVKLTERERAADRPRKAAVYSRRGWL